MASMFRKPKRNFRQRIVQNDSDDENKEESMETDDVESMPDIKPEVKKPKEKKKKDKSKTVLSFDHNEEGDTHFQVKKSSYSKKVAKQLKKESQIEKQAEALQIKQEPKDAAEKEQPVSTKAVKKEPKEDVEDRIKRLREEFQTMNGEEAEELEGNESDEDNTFKKMLRRGEIPDATTIHQIRKQRQLARDMGDFLPLDDTTKYEKNNSRLVRDDDNDKSDEEDERIDFAADQAARDRQRMKENFLQAEHGSDEGSDQEREWEEQQIRKGVSAMQQVSSSQDLLGMDQDIGQSGEATLAAVTNGQQQGTKNNGNQTAADKMGKAFQAMAPMAAANSSVNTNITLEQLVKKLKDRLSEMDEVHRGHKMEADKLITDIRDTKESIETCETSMPKLESRFRFFQEMRGYVRDLVECLNEKVPEINSLELRMNNLLKNRAAKFASRRQQDIQDQYQATMTNKQTVVMDAEGTARQRRIAEREARRARRRRAREGKNISGHHEGLSSDDEENQSEITKFNQERDEILSRSEELFEDVVDDFSDTDCVRERFSEWKRQYGETYREAYIGLCLPKLVNPFVRLQLIKWNVLEEECKDIEEMHWYESLLFYGFIEGEPIDRADDDIKLLPAIIEKIVLPKLTNIAENQWDPMSTSHTCRFVNHVKKLQRDYPTINADSKNTQLFLKAVVSRMKKTLDDDVFMPLYLKTIVADTLIYGTPQANRIDPDETAPTGAVSSGSTLFANTSNHVTMRMLENRNSGASVFFHRQLWMCIKLLGHILSWHGIVATKVLQGLALDGLLNRYILRGLQSAPFNAETLVKCQIIVSTFPKEWFSELDSEKTIPQLEGMCRFLVYAAQLLDNACASAPEIQRKELRDQLKQISKLLVNIHGLDHAMKLSNMSSQQK